jgi:hypothetical protein
LRLSADGDICHPDRRWNVGDLLEVLQGELVNIDNTAMIRGSSPVLDDEDF